MNKKPRVGKGLLETITVALYENPIILFREYVQNSLDAHNKAINKGKTAVKNFHVAINVDTKNRRIVIKDNGYGIGTDKLFRDRMKSIGISDKIHDKTRYIGFRGIGRISGLAFCDRLTFKNKAENSGKINICIWDGKKYRDSLDKEEVKDDFQTIINRIVSFDKKEISKNEKISEHFFEVVLENYTNEIAGMMNDERFEQKLIKMLPLRYKDNFKGGKEIISKYNGIMLNEPIESFMISVKHNGKDLFKKYDDNFILGSKIVFWPIIGKQKKDGSQGNKIGLLWFTFDKHLKAKQNDEYYGILTRSKNVLMGTNDTFAQVADDNTTAYITTFREMAQSLRGVYGELLINYSPFLKDNSRRDWFLPNEHSTELNNIITEFMKRLHNYRYCASRYFRSSPSKDKEDLRQALDALVNIKDNQIDYGYFYKREEAKEKEAKSDSFSEQDIPRQNESMKRCYDVLMKVIEKYFDKIKKHSLFLQLRAYISNYFTKK